MNKQPEIQAHLPIHFVEMAESLIRINGGDPERLYTFCKLPRHILSQPDARISVEQLQLVMELVLLYLPRAEPLSIQVLRHMPVTATGTVGMAAMTADTLEQALDVGLRYFSLVFPLFELRRENTGNRVHIHIRRLHDFGSPFNEVLTEMVAGGFCKMSWFARISSLRQSQQGSGMEVQLTHASTGDSEIFRRFFGAPVKFSCAGNQFILARETLRQPLLTRNRTTHNALVDQLDRQLLAIPRVQPITQRVRGLLAGSLSQGRLPDANSLAAEMAVSARTLSRRLREEGSSLPTLIDAERIERADSLLLGSDLPIGRIARRVGYSDISTFSRAYKRIKGCTPSHMRGLGEEA